MKKSLVYGGIILTVALPIGVIIASLRASNAPFIQCSSDHLVIFNKEGKTDVVAQYSLILDAMSTTQGAILYSGTLRYENGQQPAKSKVFSVTQDYHYTINNGIVRTQSDSFIPHQGTTASYQELVRFVQPTLDKRVAGNYQMMQLGEDVYAFGVNNLPRTRCVDQR